MYIYIYNFSAKDFNKFLAIDIFGILYIVRKYVNFTTFHFYMRKAIEKNAYASVSYVNREYAERVYFNESMVGEKIK